MQPLYPFTFQPLFKERVWGGRQLQALYGKAIPPEVPIGESWEITDRPGDVSVIANGPLAGRDLRWLLETRGAEVLGKTVASAERFPLLIKILDAREKLSLQVHPPAAKAALLGGEPKTEMWYIAHAEPGAELYVGLKRGTSRRDFEERLRAGNVEHCFHRVPVRAGDTMFLPSGRVHAIGAGLVIFEIQQNSDTTYRVYDWNRLGLDGKPRPLHVAESLESIDFGDFEPSLVKPEPAATDPRRRRLVSDPLFNVDFVELEASSKIAPEPGKLQVFGVISGQVKVQGGNESIFLGAGEFCLAPACLSNLSLQAPKRAMLLMVQPGLG